MPRMLNDWLDSYLVYTSHTESAKVFHKWVGLSTIASVLQRKTWFQFGMFKVFPNIFVVLTAEPGKARKTQAIRMGQDLLSEIANVKMAADVTTIQALFMDMEDSVQESYIDGCPVRHSSITISSDEFESFLGQKGDNALMIIQLTNLYDCKDGMFKYRVKSSPSNTIPNPWLNLVAGSTPDSLALSFPMSAIGGGLGSRILFVWADEREKPVAIPYHGGDKDMRSNLIADLEDMMQIKGGLSFSKESAQWWINWYDNYDMSDPNRICTNAKFSAWYSRKPTLVKKVALLCAASSRHPEAIEIEDFIRSLSLIEEAETRMELAFQGVGKNEHAAEIKLLETIVSSYGEISEEKLFQICWRDVGADKFDIIFPTLAKKGTVERVYKRATDGTNEAHYRWRGKC